MGCGRKHACGYKGNNVSEEYLSHIVVGTELQCGVQFFNMLAANADVIIVMVTTVR